MSSSFELGDEQPQMFRERSNKLSGKSQELEKFFFYHFSSSSQLLPKPVWSSWQVQAFCEKSGQGRERPSSEEEYEAFAR